MEIGKVLTQEYLLSHDYTEWSGGGLIIKESLDG